MINITDNNLKDIPTLYTFENSKIQDVKISIHFFIDEVNFHWFGFEYSPAEKIFYGFAYLNDEINSELGYFSLSELIEVSNSYNVQVELFEEPITVKDAVNKYPMLKKLLEY